MHELVHHTFHSRLLSGLRIHSFAGDGLPERMRSISFALLGLTAAAGLTFVAIFAQLGFPVLSPAPLPAEPSASQSIAGARKVATEPAAMALTVARTAPAKRAGQPAAEASPQSGSGPTDGGGEVSQVVPAEVDVPVPASAPEPDLPVAGNSGGGVAGSGTESGSSPTSAAAPAQPASTPAGPSASPPPSAAKPQPIASAPKPEPVPAPGGSSAAAAAHASERGIEASASSGPPASPAATASAGPEASSAPGNGNGLAKGLDK
jgi:hypothetical protein